MPKPEAMAVREGVKYTVQWGWRKVVVESDYLQVIHVLQAQSISSSEFHLIVDDILSLSSKLVDIVGLLLSVLVTK